MSHGLQDKSFYLVKNNRLNKRQAVDIASDAYDEYAITALLCSSKLH